MTVIALVGRPNVGKSTLFNRLTKTKDALVADQPGLTRDRKYGVAHYEEKPYTVIDTGGIGVEEADVDDLTTKQSLAALDEADIVFFMVDATFGMHPADTDIAKTLRQKENIIVIVNKTDGQDENVVLAEFYALGFKSVFGISARTGRGVKKMLADIFSAYPLEQHDADETRGIKIAIVGKPNVGKSTLVNRMLGEERVVALDMPGTTRDSVYIPFEKNDEHFTLIDTAGIRKRSRVNEKIEKFSVIKALDAINNADVCILVFDAREGVNDQDLHLIQYVVDAGKGLLLVVNKWDELEPEIKDDIHNTIDRRLGFVKFAPILFISALHGSGVGTLLPKVKKIYQSATKELPTAKLTDVLDKAVTAHQPPLVRGRRIKLKYAHSGGHKPPMIVIHGNQTDKVPVAYKRYLVHTFRKAFGLIGTPIRLQFKSSDNPYEGKKNVLTDRQKNKRKRLMKRVKKNKKK